MSKKARAMLTLWRIGRITQVGLQKAVEDGSLTQAECDLIKRL